MTTTLETERLILECITEDRLDDVHTLFSSPYALGWGPAGPTKTKDETRSRMQGLLRTESQADCRSYLIYERAGKSDETVPGTCVGLAALVPDERVGGPGHWEFRYCLLAGFAGKGFATEACRVVMDSVVQEFKDRPGKKVIVAWVSPVNAMSLRVCEKLGLKDTGRKLFEGERAFVGGAWRDDGVCVLEKEF